MLKSLTTTQVWVHDQDEALAFYTEKLGLEVREDVTVPEFGNFRWLTVGVPGQEDVSVVLMAIPGPPVFDDETRQKIGEVMAKGAATALFFATDDIQSTYDELKSRGVEFQQEPTEQPYGVDAGFRDPSGNSMRMAPLSQGPPGVRSCVATLRVNARSDLAAPRARPDYRRDRRPRRREASRRASRAGRRAVARPPP